MKTRAILLKLARVGAKRPKGAPISRIGMKANGKIITNANYSKVGHTSLQTAAVGNVTDLKSCRHHRQPCQPASRRLHRRLLQQTPRRPNRRKNLLRVFVLSGQSNMLGYGAISK